MSTFNIIDSSTWPIVLTPEHLSLIYHRSVGAIKKAVQTGKFAPMPFETKPFRWRRVDVIRHVEGARGFGLKRVG